MRLKTDSPIGHSLAMPVSKSDRAPATIPLNVPVSTSVVSLYFLVAVRRQRRIGPCIPGGDERRDVIVVGMTGAA